MKKILVISTLLLYAFVFNTVRAAEACSGATQGFCGDQLVACSVGSRCSNLGGFGFSCVVDETCDAPNSCESQCFPGVDPCTDPGFNCIVVDQCAGGVDVYACVDGSSDSCEDTCVQSPDSCGPGFTCSEIPGISVGCSPRPTVLRCMVEAEASCTFVGGCNECPAGLICADTGGGVLGCVTDTQNECSGPPTCNSSTVGSCGPDAVSCAEGSRCVNGGILGYVCQVDATCEADPEGCSLNAPCTSCADFPGTICTGSTVGGTLHTECATDALGQCAFSGETCSVSAIGTCGWNTGNECADDERCVGPAPLGRCQSDPTCEVLPACEDACTPYGEGGPYCGLDEDCIYVDVPGCETQVRQCRPCAGGNGACGGGGNSGGPFPGLTPEYKVVDPFEFLKTIGSILFPAGLGIGGFFIVKAGWCFGTSQGDPKKTQECQSTLTSAVIGMIFLLLSVAILRIIINTMFGGTA